MHWTWIVWILIYFAVGWMCSDLIDESSDAAKMTVFITWPVIIALFIFGLIAVCLVGIVFTLLKLIYKEEL